MSVGEAPPEATTPPPSHIPVTVAIPEIVKLLDPTLTT